MLTARGGWLLARGLLARTVPIDQLVDDSFVDYALQVLGPYRGRTQ